MGESLAHNGDRDDLKSEVDALNERVTANRRDIESLLARADQAATRADRADTRADAADTRAAAADSRADAADVRMDAIEASAGVDREMLDELHAAGVVSRQHAEQMEQALRSSRTIGTAIGILMASRRVGADEAFGLLRDASSRSNRKIRELADEIVRDGRSDLGTARAT